MNLNNISFILHKPQLSENIGLCARGLKNFGFTNLLLIDPKPIFPNDKILATSVGAKNIINKAKNLEQWTEAMKMRSIISFNGVYADRKGNIFFIHNYPLI